MTNPVHQDKAATPGESSKHYSHKSEEWMKQIPAQCSFWLEALARKVVQHRPDHIIEFACMFFEDQLKLREAEIKNVPLRSYFHKIRDNKRLVENVVPLDRRPDMFYDLPEEDIHIHKASDPVFPEKAKRRCTMVPADAHNTNTFRKFAHRLSAPQLKPPLFPHVSDPSLANSSQHYTLHVGTNTPWKIEVVGVDEHHVFDGVDYEAMLDNNTNAVPNLYQSQCVNYDKICNDNCNLGNQNVGICCEIPSNSLPKTCSQTNFYQNTKNMDANNNILSSSVEQVISLVEMWLKNDDEDENVVKERCDGLTEFLQSQQKLIESSDNVSEADNSISFDISLEEQSPPEIQDELPEELRVISPRVLEDNNFDNFMRERFNEVAKEFDNRFANVGYQVFRDRDGNWQGIAVESGELDRNATGQPIQLSLNTNIHKPQPYLKPKVDHYKHARSRLDLRENGIPKLETIIEEVDTKSTDVRQYDVYSHNNVNYYLEQYRSSGDGSYSPLLSNKYGSISKKNPELSPSEVFAEMYYNDGKSTNACAKQADVTKSTVILNSKKKSNKDNYVLTWGSCWGKKDHDISQTKKDQIPSNDETISEDVKQREGCIQSQMPNIHAENSTVRDDNQKSTESDGYDGEKEDLIVSTYEVSLNNLPNVVIDEVVLENYHQEQPCEKEGFLSDYEIRNIRENIKDIVKELELVYAADHVEKVDENIEILDKTIDIHRHLQETKEKDIYLPSSLSEESIVFEKNKAYDEAYYFDSLENSPQVEKFMGSGEGDRGLQHQDLKNNCGLLENSGGSVKPDAGFGGNNTDNEILSFDRLGSLENVQHSNAVFVCSASRGLENNLDSCGESTYDLELIKEYAEISEVFVNNIVEESLSVYKDNLVEAEMDQQASLADSVDTLSDLSNDYSENYNFSGFSIESEANICQLNSTDNLISMEEGSFEKNSMSDINGGFVEDTFDVDSECTSSCGDSSDTIIAALDRNVNNLVNSIVDDVKCVNYKSMENVANNQPPHAHLEDNDDFNESKYADTRHLLQLPKETAYEKGDYETKICTSINSTALMTSVDDIGETIVSDVNSIEDYLKKPLTFTRVEDYWCGGIHVIVEFVD